MTEEEYKATPMVIHQVPEKAKTEPMHPFWRHMWAASWWVFGTVFMAIVLYAGFRFVGLIP